MKLYILAIVVLMVMPFGIKAQTAPDAATLTKLLNEFLAGASRNDAAVHDRFWAEDLIYTRSAGVRVGKADIMKGLRSAPAAKPDAPTTTYTAEDIRIQQYGTTAIVAFRLVGTTVTNGNTQVANFLNTGTFLKRKRKWQVVAWQSTKMPLAEALSGQSKNTAGSSENSTLKDLVKICSEIYDAGISGRRAVIEKYLSDTFLETDVTGELQNKSWNLKNFLGPGVKMNYTIDEAQVREYDRVAVLYYLWVVDTEYEVAGTGAGSKPEVQKFRAKLRVTDTFIKRGDGWQMISSHRTRLKDE